MSTIPHHVIRSSLCAVAVAVAMLPAGSLHAALLGKFEPQTGCYLGAFIDKDDRVRGDLTAFERLTGKKHASYFTYVGYGRPFPSQWVERVKASGAAPHLALEPNDGLQVVRDDEYLHQWAREAYDADCPVFLRFASEMNGSWSAYYGDPALYREKFQLVHRVMNELAPNVALVWTPFAVPQNNIADYYPGDEAVDWVGINIYSVYVHDGDPNRLAVDEDPLEFLRFIYEAYSERKPIQVSEFAATHYCGAVKRSTEAFAVQKMRHFYEALARDFPRVKMVNWFSYDSLGHGIADNNYCLTTNERVLETYRSLVASDHFLSVVPYDRQRFRLASAEEVPPTGTLPPAGTLPTPPPVPDPRPPAPPLNPTPAVSEAQWLALLATRGANATQVSTLHLQGLSPGHELAEPVELLALVPQTLEAAFALFEVDGKVTRVTNIRPFRMLLSPGPLTPGEHRIRLLVRDRRGETHESPVVPFSVPDRAP